jgi:hypothetical protein
MPRKKVSKKVVTKTAKKVVKKTTKVSVAPRQSSSKKVAKKAAKKTKRDVTRYVIRVVEEKPKKAKALAEPPKKRGRPRKDRSLESTAKALLAAEAPECPQTVESTLDPSTGTGSMTGTISLVDASAKIKTVKAGTVSKDLTQFAYCQNCKDEPEESTPQEDLEAMVEEEEEYNEAEEALLDDEGDEDGTEDDTDTDVSY